MMDLSAWAVFKKSRLREYKGTNFCDYNGDFYKKL